MYDFSKMTNHLLECPEEVAKIEKIKCSHCGKTLLLAEYMKGEIKCPRCGKLNKIDYQGREPIGCTKE